MSTINPYQNNPLWRPISQHFESSATHLNKITHYQRHHNWDCWRLTELVKAVALTVFTAFTALISDSGRNLWSRVFSGNEVQVYSETTRNLSGEEDLLHQLQNRFLSAQHQERYGIRAKLYQQTQRLAGNLDSDISRRMIDGTKRVKPEPLAPPETRYDTVLEVVEEDTFDLAKRYADEGLNPIALNLANTYHPGGGVARGCAAQEESLFRRSNLFQALDRRLYPIPHDGSVIYSPDVQVFREGDQKIGATTANGWEFVKPWRVGVVTCAAYDLRSNREKVDHETYETNTKEKIRSILRIATIEGHDSPVLGALGCGAFRNDPKTIAGYFRDILAEDEFRGRFKKVGFGIIYNKGLLETFHKELIPA